MSIGLSTITMVGLKEKARIKQHLYNDIENYYYLRYYYVIWILCQPFYIHYRLEKAALRLYVAGVKDFYTKEFVGYILKLSIMRSA